MDEIGVLAWERQDSDGEQQKRRLALSICRRQQGIRLLKKNMRSPTEKSKMLYFL